MKDFSLARARVADHWQDDKLREFEATFVAPLEPRMRVLMTSIGELSEVLAKAERDCGSH